MTPTARGTSGKQAVRKWLALTPERQKENKLIFEQITTNLGKLESDAGNYGQAVNWFQAAKTVSLTPGDLQNRIDEIKKKMAAQPSPTNSQPH